MTPDELVHSTVAGCLSVCSRKYDITKHPMYPLLADADEGKRVEVDRIRLTSDKLKQYFPKCFTPRQMEETIFKLLEQWQQKREREMER